MNGDFQPWYTQGDNWQLTETGVEYDHSVYYETVFTQANGYMGMRGYTEESTSGVASIREGYMAGVFSDVDEQATQIIGDFPWPVLEMVSLPAFFTAEIRLNGERFDPAATGEVLSWQRTLNLRNGLLCREITWRDPHGRTTRLKFERFLSAADCHLACQRISVVPLDWEGTVKITFPLEGNVPTYFRCGDRKQPHLPQYHFQDHAVRTEQDPALVAMTTHHTGYRLAIATAVEPEAASAAATATSVNQTVEQQISKDKSLCCERFLAVACSRDEWESRKPETVAEQTTKQAKTDGFGLSLNKSAQVWKKRWDQADVQIDGAPRDQMVVRYNVFQLLQAAPFHSEHTNIPARGYAYNRYRGLYFWDTEIFMMPFFTWTFPDVSSNLLAFRHHTLPGACRNASHWGGTGVLYPWMTDSDTGLDNSIDARVWKLYHQNAAIAYAIDDYARTTGDIDFMERRGLEVLLQTARFFASRITAEQDGYHLDDLIGPDEDHKPGRDNGYTNLMARRNFALAVNWFERLAHERPESASRTRQKCELSDEELQYWRTLSTQLHVPRVPGTEIPLQDEHLLKKQPADVVGWRLREDHQHWQIEPGTAGQYRLIKQADIVLAMLLLEEEFTADQRAAAYDFYEPMTVHASSLSWNTHSIVAARLGRRDQAYEYYLKSAALDLDDHKGATQDGLHTAALGGGWQAVVLGFAGLHVDNNGTLNCNPQLPEAWQRLRFRVCYQGQRYEVEIQKDGQSRVHPL